MAELRLAPIAMADTESDVGDPCGKRQHWRKSTWQVCARCFAEAKHANAVAAKRGADERGGVDDDHAGGGSRRKRATVAVDHKPAVLLHRLWVGQAGFRWGREEVAA